MVVSAPIDQDTLNHIRLRSARLKVPVLRCGNWKFKGRIISGFIRP